MCAFFLSIWLLDVKPCLVHASKDRILLEGEETGDDDDGDEDEVFALKGIPSSDSDEDEEDVYEEGDYDEDQPHSPTGPEHMRKGGKAKVKLPPESDDEEEEGSEEEESWGRKKSTYYSSNAAELDSDDEEANELEEQEARRIQAKARDAMLDDDFGLADFDQDDAEEAEECVYPSLDVSLLTEMLPVRSLNL
jgi:U3 small nucleolar RNA-associated protein 3